MAEKAKPNRAAEKAVAQGDASESADEPREVTYSRDELVEQARNLFGSAVSGPAVVGALADEGKQNFTLDEASKLVNDFLARPEQRDGDD